MQGEKDDKIIAVCADDPEFRHYSDIKELPPHRLAEIRRFFEDCIRSHKSFSSFIFVILSVILIVITHFIHCSLRYLFYIQSALDMLNYHEK